MRILFSTNIPSPYRSEFFNELGKYCDLTVCYERHSASDRDKRWVASCVLSYKEVYLDLWPVGSDRSWGGALKRYISRHQFDRIIMTNYVSPATMEAIAYCKSNKIPYWVEYDGGFDKQETGFKRYLKKYLLAGAAGHLTTCDEHMNYLRGLGISAERIYKYPFTSISEHDIVKTPPTYEEKKLLRAKLGISEEKVIVSVGRFNYRNGEGKGFDLLFQIAESQRDIGFFIIGDAPTSRFIEWKQKKELSNIHFVPFKVKKDLFEYYLAADMQVLLTRGDVWGLVVNEAMACALPVLTTSMCMAGVELVFNGINGYIVPANTYKEALDDIVTFYMSDFRRQEMMENCLSIIKDYTIENMVKRHMEILSL